MWWTGSNSTAEIAISSDGKFLYGSNRGVGTIMLNHILRKARESGVRLLSEFISNDRNRMMYVTYRFAGFTEIANSGGTQILEHDLVSIPATADYIAVKIED